MISSLFTQAILVPLFFLLLMSLVAKNIFRAMFSWKGMLAVGVLFYLGLLTAPNITRGIGYLSGIFYDAAKTAMSGAP